MGHFDYLLEGNHQTKVASSEQLKLLADTAAKHYLEAGNNLNESIRKMASENDLNSAQIERVCELANIATHQGLWRKTAQKESIAFDLANSRNIISTERATPDTGGDCGCSAPKPVSSDYNGPPQGIPSPGPSTMSMLGVDPAKVHHGLSHEPEKKQIIVVLQKKAAERSNIKSNLIVRGMELETLQKQAFEVVKQTILGGATFRQVYEAAAGTGLGKVAEEYLPGFEERLIQDTHGETRERLEKTAIGKAPEDLVSSMLGNATIINGAHPLLVSLDTINRKTGEIRNGLHNLLRIDDEVKVYTQRMRELT